MHKILAAAHLKPAYKAPSLAFLREELRKVIRPRWDTAGAVIGGGGVAYKPLPRG